ncbi:phosphatidate cytidylyltransferase [Ruminococcus sp.]|uniref:phosphatidate cytidylyltransferase n=1 Tax=Ruminococcus sp. TaxID=41978 RepID=UPI00386C884E
MKTRLITSGIGIAVALALIILGSYFNIVITIALSLISVILCGEYLSARKLNKDIKLFATCLFFALIIPLMSYMKEPYDRYRFIPFYLFVLTMCIFSVVFHRTIKLDDIMFTLAGVSLITVCISLLNVIVWTDAGSGASADSKHTAFWIIFCLGVPWVADSGAYFAGSYLGKHKLCPDISPNKTVEGAIGGILAGTLSALLIGLIFKLVYGQVTIYYGVLVLVAFVNSIISIFGDLTFSIIKRSCKIKDFGSIMPGHGGLLDRFDSVLLCIPVVYIFSQTFYFIM